MADLNPRAKEINAKIVYYGPGRSGKTTNIQYVHAKLKPSFKGELMTLSTEQDRTLFFDFLPVDLGQIKGLQTRFHLYTVPGQVFYNSTRKLVLKNADAVVFVADSERKFLNENVESFKNLEENLRNLGRSLTELPVVLQYNKRDTPDAVPVSELDKLLNKYGFPTVQAVASRGEGVLQTLTLVSKLVVRKIHESVGEAPPPPSDGERSPLPTASSQAGLDDEEEAALDGLGPPPRPAAAPAEIEIKVEPPPPQNGPASLELVAVGAPTAASRNEIRFTLELRDPVTGRLFVAPVRLSMDMLLRPK